MTKKIKDFIKKNPEPAGGTNVNPSQLGQYSAKYNISEAPTLDRYLLSRGIDPKRTPLETKIGHSKSSLFMKWKQDHQFEEVEQTYGKKPKIDKESSIGENKPSAAATLSGGKTLTGISRDIVEIDPMMKTNKPDQPLKDVKTEKKKDFNGFRKELKINR
jgi:hypothetical protein